MWRLGFQRGERGADLPDLAGRPGCRDLGNGRSADDKAAREDHGQILTARTGVGIGRSHPLADRNGLACQEGFIGRKARCLHKHSVGGHPVAFGQHDQVAACHLALGDPQPIAAPDHQRARTGQVTQRLQHPFGPRLLHHGDTHRQAGEGQQNQRLFQAAKQQIDHTPCDQQRQHRFAQDLQHDPKGCATTRTRQFVVALGSKPGLGLGLGEALM